MTTTILEPTTTPRAQVRQPSLLRLARVELRKTYDTRAGFYLLAAVAVGTIAVVAAALLFAEDDAETDFLYLFGVTMLPMGVLLPILGILSVTSEWSQRTAMSTFALVPSRWRIAAAKLLAAAALAIGAGVIGLVCASIGNVLYGNELEFTPQLMVNTFLFHLLGIVGGVALGLLLQSSAIAIVVYFVLPTIVGVAGQLVSWLREPAEWLDTGRTFAPLLRDEMAAADAWAKLAVSAAVWIGIPLVLGLWRLVRREIT